MRLAVPIAYNFFSLTRVEKAAFFKVMGPIEYVNFLGEGFNKWAFPICLILMVVLTIFDIYGKETIEIKAIIGRFLNCIGLKQYSFDNYYAVEKVDEGKYIIDEYKH